MPDKTVEIQIPIPTQGVSGTVTAVSSVAQPFDLAVPLPTLDRADRYTAVAAVSDSAEVNIPVPTITLVSAEVAESGYLLEEEENIPEPTIVIATRYTTVAAVNTSEEPPVPIPTITLATRYTAVAPVAEEGPEHQIMVPTISEPAWELWIWTAVDTYLSVETPATYTDQTTEANSLAENDFDIFPASPIALDGFLIGMKHPHWDRIRFDIGTAAVGTYTVEWLYWNGSAWVLISNVDDDTDVFTVADRNTITFDQPTLWGLKTIDGAERYWVFCRILSMISMDTRPLGTQLWVGVIANPLDNTRQTMNEQPGIEHMTHLENTPKIMVKGEAFAWQFKLVDYRDGASQRSLLTPTVYISRDGGAFAEVVAAVTGIAHGWYYITISAALANCDRMVLVVTAPGAAQCDLNIELR